MSAMTTTALHAPSDGLPFQVLGTKLGQEAERKGPLWVQALTQDYRSCVLEQGLPVPEYATGLDEWGGDLAAYLREAGAELPAEAPAPEAAPAGPATPAPSPEAVSQGQALAAEQAARAEQAERKRVHQLLLDCEGAFQQGERAYRAGLLEAGRLALEYLRARKGLGDDRKASVQAVESRLAPWSSSAVDVGRLIRSHAAYELLAPALSGDAMAQVSFGHWQLGYALLVRAVDHDTPREGYVLLPGMEDECRALFVTSTNNGLSREAVMDAAGKLVRQHAALDAKAKADAAAKQREAEREAREARDAAETQRKALERQVADTTAEAKAETDAARKQALEASMATQLEQLRTTQEAEKAEQGRVDAAAKARKQAEQDAAAAAAAKKRADEKAARKEERRLQRERGENATPPPGEARQGTNLLAAARQGTAKDVAAMCVELLTGGDEPDDVLALVLDALDGHKALSRPSHRAVKAARLSLEKDAQRRQEAKATTGSGAPTPPAASENAA